MTTSALDHVLDLARQLAAFQDKLELLNRERDAIQEEIARCVKEVATAAVAVVAPPTAAVAPALVPIPARFTNTFAGSVMIVLHRQPDHAFSARQIAEQLNIRSGRMRDNLRTLLSRLARDERITRSAYGRYMAKRA